MTGRRDSGWGYPPAQLVHEELALDGPNVATHDDAARVVRRLR
jgi:hypothetical protein